MCAKRCLRNVHLLHLDLVVQFSEELSTMKLIQEIINNRDGEFVFDDQLIKITEDKIHLPLHFFFNTMTTSDDKGLVIGQMMHASNGS